MLDAFLVLHLAHLPMMATISPAADDSGPSRSDLAIAILSSTQAFPHTAPRVRTAPQTRAKSITHTR